MLVGPAGTGKSHLLVALGHAAVVAGLRVRYFAAVDLVEDLYRGLADNSVGKILDGLLRADLVICDELGFAPLDVRGSQLLFRFVAAMYERRSLAIARHWPLEEWGRFFPETVPATSLLDPRPPPRQRGRHQRRELPDEGGAVALRTAREGAPGGRGVERGPLSGALRPAIRSPRVRNIPARAVRRPTTTAPGCGLLLGQNRGLRVAIDSP